MLLSSGDAAFFNLFDSCSISSFLDAVCVVGSRISKPKGWKCTPTGYQQRLTGLEYLAPIETVSLLASTFFAVRGIEGPKNEFNLKEEAVLELAGFWALITMFTTPGKACAVAESQDHEALNRLADLSVDEARTFRRQNRQLQLISLGINSAFSGVFVLLTEQSHQKINIAIAASLPILYTGFRLLTFDEWKPEKASALQIAPTLMVVERGRDVGSKIVPVLGMRYEF